jgi:hypothetical protein
MTLIIENEFNLIHRYILEFIITITSLVKLFCYSINYSANEYHMY